MNTNPSTSSTSVSDFLCAIRAGYEQFTERHALGLSVTEEAHDLHQAAQVFAQGLISPALLMDEELIFLARMMRALDQPSA
jgi:hypothetical protein